MTDDDRRYRSAYRGEEPKRDSLLADTIDVAVRRIVTGMVLAGALIGAGIYLSGGAEPARYQVTATSDGRIVRLNTDSGSLVVCEGNDCTIIQRGSAGLRRSRDRSEETTRQEAAPTPPPAQLPAPQPEAALAPEAQAQPEQEPATR
jgi:hypothetical protein